MSKLKTKQELQVPEKERAKKRRKKPQKRKHTRTEKQNPKFARH
jgi:hypothetical protein